MIVTPKGEDEATVFDHLEQVKVPLHLRIGLVRVSTLFEKKKTKSPKNGSPKPAILFGNWKEVP